MNNNLLKYILWWCLVSFALVGKSQNYLTNWECLSVEEGLSNRFVRAIIQDYKGFIWVATQYGLNRYDRQQFKVFTKESNQLQRNFINNLYQDEDSLIWVTYSKNNHSNSEVDMIDLMDVNQLKNVPIQERIQLPFPLESLYTIYQMPNSKIIYLATKDGTIYTYKGQNNFELFYTHDKKTAIKDFVVGENYYWLLCENELVTLNKEQQLVYRTPLDKKANPNRCNIIGERNQQSVWVLLHYEEGNVKKSAIYTMDTPSLSKHRLDSFVQTARMAFDTKVVLSSKNNTSLFFNRRHLAVFDAKGDTIYKYAIEGQYISACFVDQDENIWVGVDNKGLCKLSYQKNKFNTLFDKKPLRAMAYLPGDSSLLANSYEGFLLSDLKNKEYVVNNALGLDLLLSKDKQRIWISSEHQVLEAYYLNNFQLAGSYDFYASEKKQLLERSGVNIDVNWAVHEDKKGRIWLGTNSGVGYLNPQEDSLHVFWKLNAFEDFITSSVNYFYENDQGLWVATSLGLYLIDFEKGILKKYSEDAPNGFAIPHHYILHLHEDKAGYFWLSTRGGGIIKMHPSKGGSCQQFTTQQGLSHNIVYAILEDEDGLFWMSSDYGLMRFDPQSHVVNTFLPKDGIPHEEFNHTSFYKAADGQFYFGGVAGAVGFNPKDFSTKVTYNIPLQIVKYQYFDGRQSLLIDQTVQLVQDNNIVLNYTDRFFILEFSLLDYNASKDNHYAYKIEGLDQEWHYINNNSIRVNSLPTGNYTLLVKGQGKNGMWSSSQLRISIQVKQPFYFTWQFLLLVLALGGLYLLWRIYKIRKDQERLEEEVKKRTQKIEEQANKLRELDDVKSRFFANISHELRTPLTLMLGPISAILGKHYGDDLNKILNTLEITKRNGQQLQNLIEEILTLSKLESNKIQLELDEVLLLPTIRRIFDAFETQAELQKIELNLTYDIAETLVVLLDEHKFEKILNNLLSNAIKYTPSGGTVQLQLTTKNRTTTTLMVTLAVIDSGQGILADDLPHVFNRFYQSKHKEAIVEGGTGIGLALAYEFAKLMQGTLTVESTWGKGSTFVVQLPLAVVADSALHKTMESIPINPLSTPLPTPNDPRSSATILVVEDNVDMRLFIQDLLTPYYQVLCAENGKIALELLEKNASNIDLILSDVMMPELDGFQLLKIVKEHPQWQQTPVVMLTARATEQDKLYALRIGVDDYLPKPFSHQELLVRIKNLLQNYQQRKTWQTELTKLEEEEEGDNDNNAIDNDLWLQQVEAIAKKQVGNSQFGITNLAYDLEMSERHFRRKLKDKTGLNPNEYFRLIKLDVARQYLEAQKYSTVAEVAHQIGFSNDTHFSKIYYEQFGKRPIDYLR